MVGLQPIIPILAALSPPLAYLGACRLMAPRPDMSRADACHGLPVIGIGVLVAVFPRGIDAGLILIYIGYAGAMLRLVRRGPDALGLAPLATAATAYRAILFSAAALLISAGADILILFDIEGHQGTEAAGIITYANILGILAIAGAAWAAAPGAAEDRGPESPPAPLSASDAEVLGTLNDFMTHTHAYRDANLTLDRLARKTGIPARRISAAVNRSGAHNVSHYVNAFRIGEACMLLAETSLSVTDIMLACGFQTKSNFNREFKRIAGFTPTEWREKDRKA